jgi:hypothetical protein
MPVPVMMEFLRRIPRTVLNSMLNQAGVTGIQTTIVAEDITRGIEPKMTLDELRELLVLILRYMSVENADFAALAQELNIPLQLKTVPSEVNVSVPFATSSSTDAGIPITELVASSAVVWETSHSVKDVLQEIGVSETF